MGIFAREDIPAGEEITYDYMFQSSGLAAAAAAYRYDRCRGELKTVGCRRNFALQQACQYHCRLQVCEAIRQNRVHSKLRVILTAFQRFLPRSASHG